VPRRLRKTPEAPADGVSIRQRSEAAFNERAWPDIPNCSRRSVSSCHVLAERRGAINCTGPVPYHPVCLGITSPGSRRSVCRPAVAEEQDRAGTPGCSAAARWALSTAPVARAFMVTGDRACAAFSTLRSLHPEEMMTPFPVVASWNLCPLLPVRGMSQPASA
jgi:hypothetical protein